jgi:hypothetical protein
MLVLMSYECAITCFLKKSAIGKIKYAYVKHNFRCLLLKIPCTLYRCEIIRGGMKEYLTPVGPTPLHVSPIFEIGPVEPRFSEWLVFEGISVDESGKQHFLDASVAYKRAVLNAIEYLSKFGYSKEQVESRVTDYYLQVYHAC